MHAQHNVNLDQMDSLVLKSMVSLATAMFFADWNGKRNMREEDLVRVGGQISKTNYSQVIAEKTQVCLSCTLDMAILPFVKVSKKVH